MGRGFSRLREATNGVIAAGASRWQHAGGKDKYIMEQKYTAAAVCGRLATSGGPLSSPVRLPTAMRGA